jgi:hypothetical protein
MLQISARKLDEHVLELLEGTEKVLEPIALR